MKVNDFCHRHFIDLEDIHIDTIPHVYFTKSMNRGADCKCSNYLYNKNLKVLEIYMRNYSNPMYCESSLGVQSSCHSIMKSHGRENAEERQMQAWIDKAREIGIEKINLDFMYGIHGQDESSIEKDLQLIKLLHPQQVTLYELRTNMIPSAKTYPKETLYDQYSHYYDGLINMGYVARFGQNTFSVDADDQGVSSYIRERMINGAPYRGFGISAQSMCSAGVSYNKGKNQPIQHLLNDTSYPEEYTYRLPSNELASKYIAISAYNGSFSVDRLKELCYYDTIKETLDFCLDNDLLELHNNRAYITRKGFKHYGAVFSLIHSPR